MPRDTTLTSNGPSGYAGIPSAEGSRFGQAETYWAPSSGNEGLQVTTADRLVGLGKTAAAGYAMWHFGPGAINAGINFAGGISKDWEKSTNPVTKWFAKVMRSKPIDASSNQEFWYQFAKRVETSERFGPYLSSIFRVFAKASYASEALSFYADRGDLTHFWDLSSKTLGSGVRQDSIEYLNQVMGISKDRLQNLSAIGFKNNKIWAVDVFSDEAGKKTYKLANEILADNVRLIDKGRFSFGLLTRLFPWAGSRDLHTGEIRGLKLLGPTDYVPVKADMGGKVFLSPLSKNPLKTGPGLEIAQGYGAMALQRTSFLIDDMINEIKGLVEFIDPKLEKKVFGTGYRLGIIPQFSMGPGSVMMGRYAKTALKAFGGLALLNQAGFMTQHGKGVESAMGGVIQGGVLAYAGSRAASLFGKSNVAGAALGGALGLLGGFGLPPFNNGVIPGIASLAGGFKASRAQVGELIPIFGSKWRRGIEDFAPGAGDFTTAVGMGILSGGAYVGLQRALKRETIITDSARRTYLRAHKWDTIKDLLDKVVDTSRGPELEALNKLPTAVRTGIDNEILGYVKYLEDTKNWANLNNVFGKAGDTYRMKAGRLSEMLTNRAFEEIRSSVMEEGGHWLRKVNTMIERAPFFRAAGYAAVLGTAGWSLLSGGMLGSLDTAKEVRAKNQGKILEPVRRGQKWEFGSTPYEGTDILYYRPTWIARLKSGATQAGSTGDRGMVEEFFLKNFSYKLERDNYYSRPAPISSAAFDQIPFVYPLIKPLADLIKRPKLMHVDEWARVEGDTILYKEQGSGLEALPNPELGATSMTAPASPYTYGRVLGKTWQELTSLSGLVGFYAREAMGIATGDTGLSSSRPELQSFSQNVDMVSRFYDLQTGGGFMGIPFVSEPLRRFLVNNKVDSYNPIANQMPSWLPAQMGMGNQYASLLHGAGEYRLPGEGYAARFRELKGIDPEDYPLLHRLNILGDVAPWSTEYRTVKSQVLRGIQSGQYDEKDAAFFYNYTRAVETRMDKRSYASYMFNKNQYEEIGGEVESFDPNTLTFTISGYGGRYSIAGLSNAGSDLVGQLNLSYKQAARVQRQNARAAEGILKPGMSVNLTIPRGLSAAVDEYGSVRAAVKTSTGNINAQMARAGNFAREESIIGEYSMTQGIERGIGKVWQSFIHNIGMLSAPAEYVSMFGASPVMKFLAQRDALEEYEQMHLYGEDIRLWQKPVAHWFAPALRTLAHNWLGQDFVASSIQQQRDVEEYFDKLKYHKYTMLASEAYEAGDVQMAKHYESVRRRTILGSHGFYDERRFKNVLGGAEARYGLGFARETTPERQQGILEAIPEFKRRTMTGQYAQQQMKALERLNMAGGLGPEGDAYLRRLRALRQDEGYERNERLTREYAREGGEGESYADYMRRKELAAFFQNRKMPAANWIGFNPAVDLEDVKLKYIEGEGMDYHDFSIYPSRAKYIHRKPYITDQDIQQISVQPNALMHATTALRETARIMGLPMNSLAYNLNSPVRPNSYVSLDLTQNFPYYPDDY